MMGPSHKKNSESIDKCYLMVIMRVICSVLKLKDFELEQELELDEMFD